MPEGPPVFWPVTKLIAEYRSGRLSPVEVTQDALGRIDEFDDQLHSYVTVTSEMAREQAREAERRYRSQEAPPPLLGVPTAIKDLFDMRGVPTSLGSLVYRDQIAAADSQVVAALRRAGAILIGKTNTSEFGQSATTENLLGLGCGNPWDNSRTAGGSSGGSAASVGAGLASVALGSDGGGSVRIPAALCGLVGLKPTYGSINNGSTFHAMTAFACPGPIVRRVADVRPFMTALWGRELPRQVISRLRIAWCAQPEQRPVDPGVAASTQAAVHTLAEMGHEIDEVEIPSHGWMEAFGPLVLADEWRYRRHLLQESSEELTRYARRSIEEAKRIDESDVLQAQLRMAELGARINALFEDYDLVLTPTTATTAFPIGQRPTQIDGRDVDSLWGPFPFTAPFNVAGNPAVSLPCGLPDGLPVGLQLVAAMGGEERLLNLCEELEEAVCFPAERMIDRWDVASPASFRDGEVSFERRQTTAIVRIARPAKRGALTLDMLDRLLAALASDAVREAPATVLTGGLDVFSAGADLSQVGHGVADLAMDDAVGAVGDAIRSSPFPVLAAVEGPCIGAALELAITCDVVVAGESSVFALPSTKLGILYRPAGLRGLVKRLGYQAVARLILIGEWLPAESALRAGIVSDVVPDGEALTAALLLAESAGHSGRKAAATTKALLIAAESGEEFDLGGWEVARRNLLDARGRRHVTGAVDTIKDALA